MKFKEVNKSKCHCITMRRASNAITEYYDKAMEKVGLSASQYSLLVNLNRLGEASTSDLAEYVNLERSTLVRSLKPLISKGYIDDLAKAGARNHRYTVSEEGEMLLKKGLPIWEETQEKIKDFLGREKVEQFMEMLYHLQELKAE